MRTYNSHSIVGRMLPFNRRYILLDRELQNVFLAVFRRVRVFPDVLPRNDVLDNVEYGSHELLSQVLSALSFWFF